MRKSIVLAILGLLLGGVKHLLGQNTTGAYEIAAPVGIHPSSESNANSLPTSYIFDPGDTAPFRYATIFEKRAMDKINAQSPAGHVPNIYDEAYRRYAIVERVPLQYSTIREADVAWAKRLWREIDIREKMNAHFAFAEMPLMEVLLQMIKNYPEQPLFYADESFTTPITYDEVIRKLKLADSLQICNEETFTYEAKLVEKDPDLAQFQRFRVKEEWIIDTRMGALTQRILGIAPVRDVFTKDNEFIGTETLFWLYYPNSRDVLSSVEAINPYNDLLRMSWTDVFDMRFFSSIITKENNNKDRRIQDYAYGRNAALESARITEEIFNLEHDLWEW